MRHEIRLDEELVRRARDGDRDAFAAIVAATAAAMRAFLATILDDPDDVDDVAQIAYTRAWRKIESLRREERFIAWLWRIARYAAIDLARIRTKERRGRSSASLDEIREPAAEEADARIWIDREALLARVREGIDRLPAMPRRLIELRYGDELSYADIGRRVGLSESQVKARLARARIKMRDRLGAVAREWERLRHELP